MVFQPLWDTFLSSPWQNHSTIQCISEVQTQRHLLPLLAEEKRQLSKHTTPEVWIFKIDFKSEFITVQSQLLHKILWKQRINNYHLVPTNIAFLKATSMTAFQKARPPILREQQNQNLETKIKKFFKRVRESHVIRYSQTKWGWRVNSENS